MAESADARLVAARQAALRPKTARATVIAKLRGGIAQAERWRAAAPDRLLRLGGTAGPTLTLGGLQELRAPDYRDGPAALGFALAAAAEIARARKGALVWLQLAHEARAGGRAYGHGLEALGCDPARLSVVYPSTVKDFLWAAEEAAGAHSVAAVLMELHKPHRLLDLTATRRLQLAAERSGATPILLRVARTPEVTAAVARWRVESAPSPPRLSDARAPGAPAWRVTLERCRRGGRGKLGGGV